MEPFTRVAGIAAPLTLPNIDTDVIMPKQFLKRIDREGLAEGVFHDLQFRDGIANPDFVLNKPAYRDACFLVTGENFGCGSSREHAVWGLMQAGIRAVLAPSFASIFFGNCEKNGLLAIVLPGPVLGRIAALIEEPATNRMTIDLTHQTIALADGDRIDFAIEPERRENLLSGRDHVAHTLEFTNDIRAFEADHRSNNTWFAGERRKRA
tara:strand:+ start:9459 stop:10085 length:627 start_codon:yes stop_codon:yes gene_type:complete